MARARSECAANLATFIRYLFPLPMLRLTSFCCWRSDTRDASVGTFVGSPFTFYGP